MYDFIGKEKWQELPPSFTNLELAASLDGDDHWWCWLTMYPHKSRKNNKGEPLYCTMNYGISFSKTTGLFIKFMQVSEIA